MLLSILDRNIALAHKYSAYSSFKAVKVKKLWLLFVFLLFSQYCISNNINKARGGVGATTGVLIKILIRVDQDFFSVVEWVNQSCFYGQPILKMF